MRKLSLKPCEFCRELFKPTSRKRRFCSHACAAQGIHRAKHGHSGGLKKDGQRIQVTRTYASWNSMIARCSNPRNKDWNNYGGRGIEVHPHWREFALFLQDMGECPPLCQLDRINNNGNYEPGNCRWATRQIQGNNKRNNRRITFNGQSMTIAEWARHLSMNHRLIRNRLKNGWPIERILTTPAMTHREVALNRWAQVKNEEAPMIHNSCHDCAECGSNFEYKAMREIEKRKH